MMKSLFVSLTLLAISFVATTDAANAVVYCTYVGYPAACVVRPGIVLRPRPVVVAPVVVAPVRRRGVVVVR